MPDLICNFHSQLFMTLFAYCSLFRCIRTSEWIGFGIKFSDDVNNLCYYCPMPNAFSQGSLSSACTDLNAIGSLFACLSPNAMRFQDSACRDPRSVDRSRFSTELSRVLYIQAI
jgi:hypothetical protein